jgi:hypothetical protein
MAESKAAHKTKNVNNGVLARPAVGIDDSYMNVFQVDHCGAAKELEPKTADPDIDPAA